GGNSGGFSPNETHFSRHWFTPPVTNLSVSVENLCTIIWTWNPPEGASPNCSLKYFSHFGNNQDKKIAPETHRSKEVPLNERICLQVGSQCSTNESEKPSILVEKCISPPEGDPESAVTELQCIWHNLRYMKCTWLPGRNTSPDTNYTLSYCPLTLFQFHQCSVQAFGCVCSSMQFYHIQRCRTIRNLSFYSWSFNVEVTALDTVVHIERRVHDGGLQKCR
ncbi:hypothetical protein FD755_015983, partial [Muntiacus reevesi]